MEVFLPVQGFEGLYEISDHGTLRSVDRKVPRMGGGRAKDHILTCRGRVIKTHGDTVGYKIACMHKVGQKPFYISVHRLVAKHFVDNPDNLPQVNHKDGDKLNNHYSNLEWCTPQQNIEHARANGLKQGKFMSKETVRKAKKLLAEGMGVHKVAETLNVKPALIAPISQGKAWKKL
jgi:hypothetical protein